MAAYVFGSLTSVDNAIILVSRVFGLAEVVLKLFTADVPCFSRSGVVFSVKRSRRFFDEFDGLPERDAP